MRPYQGPLQTNRCSTWKFRHKLVRFPLINNILNKKKHPAHEKAQAALPPTYFWNKRFRIISPPHPSRDSYAVPNEYSRPNVSQCHRQSRHAAAKLPRESTYIQLILQICSVTMLSSESINILLSLTMQLL